MTELVRRLRRISLVGMLAVLSSVPARAAVPTSCTDFKKMHDEIYRLTNGLPTYLPLYGGSPVSLPTNPADPLVNHVRDFFHSAFYNKIDPRFMAAIGRQESGLGTADPDGTGGTTEEVRDNFIGWQAGPQGRYQNFYYLGGVGGSIDVLGGYLGDLVSQGCSKIEQYVTHPCKSFGAGDPTLWKNNVPIFYGQFGGAPNTNDLTFMKGGLGGDCCHGGCGRDLTADCGMNPPNIPDILTLVQIALGDLPVSYCLEGANDGSCSAAAAVASSAAMSTLSSDQTVAQSCGTVGIAEILTAINSALRVGHRGCLRLRSYRPSWKRAAQD